MPTLAGIRSQQQQQQQQQQGEVPFECQTRARNCLKAHADPVHRWA
eukprot:CAMPEP_0177471702 /NCGR_PEP_ID=MMETSP0369-20130122/20904_1 /TAXON_ID=447022 ORGANISM="Scrippsiella hangoei-like, Strain SHHI-4" /NCGR_SAMPLE_ID=MMETSP0369 /ASSEMBLY_ACC=CAM_ASM_000364 /LENGTH=45 /DNA_ID= /DNA_START= /DNA_END= /DNA_ORIENTATION=